MSALRKVSDADRGQPCPTGPTAYLIAYNAVKAQPGLIHGRLHDGCGGHCAIGSVWEADEKIALKSDFIDEVAMVNDSVPPSASPKTRRRVVLRWLRWKLAQAGMPGFAMRKDAPPVLVGGKQVSA